MKRLILLKHSDAIDTAHLYEHIFCGAVYKYFKKKKLFEYLDYSLVGKTHRPGVIQIDVELYSPEAIGCANELKSLDVAFDQETIAMSIAQILAEEQKPLFITDFTHLQDELIALHKHTWQTIDDFESFDGLNKKTRSGPFYVAKGEAQVAQRFSVGVYLDPEFAKLHRELLPLFRELAVLVTDNLRQELISVYGSYSYKSTFKHSIQETRLIDEFRAADVDGIRVDPDAILASSQSLVTSLYKAGVFKRYSKVLGGLSSLNDPNLSPDLEANYADTRFLMGSAGWKNIATDKNVSLVLANSTFGVKLAQDSVLGQVLLKKQSFASP